MKRHLIAFAAGTVLSGLAAALMAWTDPYATLPRLAGRSPWSAYRALAAAPTGSAVLTFAVSAVIYAACFLAAAVTAPRRPPASQPVSPPAPLPGTLPGPQEEPTP